MIYFVLPLGYEPWSSWWVNDDTTDGCNAANPTGTNDPWTTTIQSKLGLSVLCWEGVGDWGVHVCLCKGHWALFVDTQNNC